MKNAGFLARYGGADHIDQVLKDGNDKYTPAISRAFHDNFSWEDRHTEILSNSRNDTLRAMSATKIKSHERIKDFLDDEDGDTNENLARNPNLSSEHIHTLIDRSKHIRDILPALANNPALKSEHIKRFAGFAGFGAMHHLLSNHVFKDSGQMDKESLTSLLSNPNAKDYMHAVKASEVYKKHFSNE